MDEPRSQTFDSATASRQRQLWCAYCGYVFVIVFWLAFWLSADFIPPPAPSELAQQIAQRFRDNTTGIRLGMVIGIFVSALLLPWGAVISAQMKRIEGRSSPFAYTWIAATALLVVEFIYPCAWWGLAAFRPDDSSEIIRRFNDMAWLAFVGVAGTVVLQALMLGALVLTDDRPERVYPRWFGYFNLWCALLIVPAGLVFFAKDGPFAWNGLMAFWLVVVVYCGWTIVLTMLTVRAIKVSPVSTRPGTSGLSAPLRST